MSIDSFEAIRYRGIAGLSLKNLSRANLITGENGVGKTALIEALWLFTGRRNPGLLWNTNVQRSSHPVIDPVAELSDGPIELVGSENGKEDSWKIEFEAVERVERVPFDDSDTESPPIAIAGRLHSWIGDELIDEGPRSMRDSPNGAVLYGTPSLREKKGNCIIEGTSWQLVMPDEFLQRYSDMVREGRKRALTEATNLILPGIQDIEILTDKSGKSYLSANTVTNVQLPLQALGGGVVRLFRLYLNFFTARRGMVLVDELENGMHHSVLRDLWGLVRSAMHEWDVQFVATTHSAECIEAAMAVFESEPDDLSIHKLYRDESGGVKAVTFAGETLEGARDLDLEIR
ncbi:MAG: AAA family ATPase [Candidatus Tectomicrobia bacterium]|nr:AAA family ATPase [Candidatus Tectomicrobia bacterium]